MRAILEEKRTRLIKCGYDLPCGTCVCSQEEREAFAALVAVEGLYRIRLRSAPSEDASEGAAGGWVVASVRACDLVTTGFKEEIKVTSQLHVQKQKSGI